MKKACTFSIPEEINNKLIKYCKKLDKSKSNVLEEIVTEKINQIFKKPEIKPEIKKEEIKKEEIKKEKKEDKLVDDNFGEFKDDSLSRDFASGDFEW